MWPISFYFTLKILIKRLCITGISLLLSASLFIIINAIICRWGWAVLIRALSMLPDVAALISYRLTETLKNVSIKHSSFSLDIPVLWENTIIPLFLAHSFLLLYLSPSGWFHWLKELIGQDACRRWLNELFKVMWVDKMFGEMSLDNMILVVYKGICSYSVVLYVFFHSILCYKRFLLQINAILLILLFIKE